jgi:hypothetical protein
LTRWQDAFKRFGKKDETSKIPSGFLGEYLIFAMADGKMARRDEVAKRYTLPDAMKWFHLRSYDNAIQEEQHKRAMKEAQRGRR